MSQRNIWSKLIDTMSKQHGWIYLCRKMWLQRISILLSCAWMYRCTISYINSIDLINIIQMWIMISEKLFQQLLVSMKNLMCMPCFFLIFHWNCVIFINYAQIRCNGVLEIILQKVNTSSIFFIDISGQFYLSC